LEEESLIVIIQNIVLRGREELGALEVIGSMKFNPRML
jgi:hypothetical protein